MFYDKNNFIRGFFLDIFFDINLLYCLMCPLCTRVPFIISHWSKLYIKQRTFYCLSHICSTARTRRPWAPKSREKELRRQYQDSHNTFAAVLQMAVTVKCCRQLGHELMRDTISIYWFILALFTMLIKSLSLPGMCQIQSTAAARQLRVFCLHKF